jgi:glycosyltransferase involved in cell wall biosynthesis
VSARTSPQNDVGVSVSIITPTLNAERYLSECLHSVERQSSSALEHLVVDGGSTDTTEQIVRASGASWVACPGLKQSAAINVGLRLARGEVVAWLNADDFYTSGTLDYIQHRFASEPDLHALVGDCDVVDVDGKHLWRSTPGPYDYRRLLRRGNFIAQPAVFLRKCVFDQVGYLDESLDFAMDYELWLRLRRLNVAYVPRVLAVFRWHARSKTATNLEANWRELLRIVRCHGGGWTPPLIWSYIRARLALARQRLTTRLSDAQ